jgi:hypothetical protein
MKEQVFGFKVTEDKEIKVYRKSEMQSIIKSLDKGEYEWVLRKKKKKRSLSQQGYYRGCLVPAIYDGFVDIGYAKKDLSYELVQEFLKDKFLFKEIINEDTGEVMRVPKSTTECSTIEMNEYHADIQQFGAEFLSITIADPNTQSDLDL